MGPTAGGAAIGGSIAAGVLVDATGGTPLSLMIGMLLDTGAGGDVMSWGSAKHEGERRKATMNFVKCDIFKDQSHARWNSLDQQRK